MNLMLTTLHKIYLLHAQFLRIQMKGMKLVLNSQLVSHFKFASWFTP